MLPIGIVNAAVSGTLNPFEGGILQDIMRLVCSRVIKRLTLSKATDSLARRIGITVFDAVLFSHPSVTISCPRPPSAAPGVEACRGYLLVTHAGLQLALVDNTILHTDPLMRFWGELEGVDEDPSVPLKTVIA